MEGSQVVSKSHPYVPRDLHLPGYVPCFLSVSNILSVYIFSSLLLVSLVWIFSGKEYSKADSRYAGRNAAVVAFEGPTAAFVGPACLLVVYAIATGKSYSYILQFVISLGQLYGIVVYYITGILEGYSFSASSFYYYAYYIGANSLWIVIPSIVAIRSWRKICAAFRVEGGQTEKPKLR